MIVSRTRISLSNLPFSSEFGAETLFGTPAGIPPRGGRGDGVLDVGSRPLIWLSLYVSDCISIDVLEDALSEYSSKLHGGFDNLIYFKKNHVLVWLM